MTKNSVVPVLRGLLTMWCCMVALCFAADKTKRGTPYKPGAAYKPVTFTEQQLLTEAAKVQPQIDALSPSSRLKGLKVLLKSDDPRVVQLLPYLDFSGNPNRPKIQLVHGPTVPPPPCAPDPTCPAETCSICVWLICYEWEC